MKFFILDEYIILFTPLKIFYIFLKII